MRNDLVNGTELTVLQMASEGRTFASIARALNMSHSQVKCSLSRAYRRLEVNNLTHAVATCMALDLIPGPLV